MTYTITLADTPGIYGSDDQGEPWTTFEAINHGYTCGECGATIDRGWVRGRLGEEQLHVCSKHVELLKDIDEAEAKRRVFVQGSEDID